MLIIERLLPKREQMNKDRRGSKPTKRRLELNSTENLSNREQEQRDLKIKLLLPEKKLSKRLPRLLKLQGSNSRGREKLRRRELELLRSKEFRELSKIRFLLLLKSSRISKTRRRKS